MEHGEPPRKTVQPQCGVGVARLVVFGIVWWSRWRKLCLLRDCNCRDQHLYIGIFLKGLVASLCNHTSEVWYCAWAAHVWLGSKLFGTFTRIVVKVYNLCRVKTNRLAMLTVKSGLDPHMINKLKDEYKSHSGYFLWPCWVPTISVLTFAYCCSEEKVAEKYFKDDAEF